jgi:hypothetical protein
MKDLGQSGMFQGLSPQQPQDQGGPLTHLSAQSPEHLPLTPSPQEGLPKAQAESGHEWEGIFSGACRELLLEVTHHKFMFSTHEVPSS